MNKILNITLLGLALCYLFASPSETKAALVVPVAGDCSAECQQTRATNDFYQKLGTERLQTLEQYRQFFNVTGAQIDSYTLGRATVYQYQEWQQELIKAKDDYDVQQKKKLDDEQAKLDQENKVKDLQKRVTDLENQNTATTSISVIQEVKQPAPVVQTSPVITKKIEQTISSKTVETKVNPSKNQVGNMEIKPLEQYASTSIEKPQPVIQKKLGWWQRFLNWFRR